MKRRALTDEVGDAIREAIVAGRLAGGRRISEEDLAAKLQVSRGTVREALLRLSGEGLIERRSHRGATVTELRRADMVEISTLRTALEGLAGEWACRNATPADLRALQDAVSALEEVDGDGAAMAARDVAFHDAIFSAAHHERLQLAWSALRSQLQLSLVQSAAQARDAPTHGAERPAALAADLTAALAARNPELVDRLIVKHLTAGSRRVLGSYGPAEPPSEPPPATPMSAHGLAPGPARRRVAGEEVADTIRDAIARGVIPAGFRLREDELATELQVSRGPVREAILRLVDEGLVRHERHRGATVVRLTEKDIDELFSLRAVLERLAARFACVAASDQEIKELKGLLRSAEADDVTRLDLAFHDALFMAAHHRRLYRAWYPLRGQISLFLGVPETRTRVRSTEPAGKAAVQHWQADHEELVNLLSERETAALQAMITDHLRQTHERALYRRPSSPIPAR